MSNALYLLASLPMLKLGDQPPLSIEELRYSCTGVMSEQELSAFDALVAGDDHEDPFVASYYAHETQLKNVAGRLRAAAWGPDVRFSERSFVGFDVTFAKMVSDAFAKTDPLEREMDLDKARFSLVFEEFFLIQLKLAVLREENNKNLSSIPFEETDKYIKKVMLYKKVYNFKDKKTG